MGEAPLGEVMIWGIAARLQEWLVENNKPLLGAHEQMMAKLMQEENEDEEKRLEV